MPGARTVTLDLPPFTLIGATTRTGLLTTPLRDRFGVCHRLEHYDAADLRQIVLRSAGILGIDVTPDGAEEISSRARGTPRVANRLLRRVRDFAEVKERGKIDAELASDALEMLEVDRAGLDRHDRQLLELMAPSSAAARWASRHWRWRSERRPTRSRTSSSPTSSSRAW